MSDPTPATAPDSSAPPAPPAAATPSPGALLRQARERAGVPADELAAQIKLARGTLEALERDDFDALSEPVYVRGYYRKIAKVLPVAEAELLAAYDARVRPQGERPPVQRIPLAGGVEAGASRRTAGPGIAVLVAAVVLGALLFLLMGRESTPRQTSRPAPADTPAPAPAMPRAATDSAAPAAPLPPAAVPDQLVLEFSDSSFVRVEDSRTRTLAIGLVRAGERQALDGAPPYSVFLGNARNVKVFFNGQPVDFSAHINTQNDTARFTVP